MTRATLTVITATKNCASQIGGLIASLRRQTDNDFTWIVADSNSSDETLDKVQCSGLKDVRVSSEPDFSIYDAINRSLRLCTSDYYIVLGADDILAPNAIADFRKAAGDGSAAMVVAAVDTFGAVRRPLAGKRWLRGGNAITASHSVGTLIRRDLHDRLGFYSNRYVNAADMHFVLKVADDPDLQIVAAPFVAGHFSNDGISSTDILSSLSDFFRLQIANGESVALQSALYGLRLMRALLRHRAAAP